MDLSDEDSSRSNSNDSNNNSNSSLESRLRGVLPKLSEVVEFRSSRSKSESSHNTASSRSLSNRRMEERHDDKYKRPLRGRWPPRDQFNIHQQQQQQTGRRHANKCLSSSYNDNKKKWRFRGQQVSISSYKNLNKLSYILITVIIFYYLKTTEFTDSKKPKLLFVGAHELSNDGAGQSFPPPLIGNANVNSNNHHHHIDNNYQMQPQSQSQAQQQVAEQKRPLLLVGDSADSEELTAMRVARAANNNNQVMMSATRNINNARQQHQQQSSSNAVAPTGE